MVFQNIYRSNSFRVNIKHKHLLEKITFRVLKSDYGIRVGRYKYYGLGNQIHSLLGNWKLTLNGFKEVFFKHVSAGKVLLEWYLVEYKQIIKTVTAYPGGLWVRPEVLWFSLLRKPSGLWGAESKDPSWQREQRLFTVGR